MKEKKIPGMYFYPADWLVAPEVRGMTDQQYRAYHTLLCTAWISTPQATLPNTDEELARLVSLPVETWNSIKEPIMELFHQNGGGRLVNDKLTKTYKEAKQKYEASAKRWANERKRDADE